MRPKLLLLVVCVVGVAFAIEGAMADFDGLIDIDENSDYSVSKNSEIVKAVERVDRSVGGGEDDEDDYGSVMSDESGSGSGNESVPTTDIDFTFITSTAETKTGTTDKTTTIDNEIIESSEEPSETPENEITDDPGIDGEEGETTDDDVVFGGGVSEPDPSNGEDSPNAEARVDTKSALTVLTTEVIAAVVVGAICAVILIAFLVYRLRKRDEGSYALSDSGYKDTYKLQGDTGKEAFV